MKEVFWINGELSPHLAIVLRPRGEDWLDDELRRMRANGVETVVSMLESEEAELLGLAEEKMAAQRVGLSFLNFPIRDTKVPADIPKFRRFVTEVANRLAGGEYVGVHCRGSIGRATVLSACALICLGWNPSEALTAIERARGAPVPDTLEQAAWIKSFKS